MCVHLSKMSISVMVVYAVLDVVCKTSDFSFIKTDVRKTCDLKV